MIGVDISSLVDGAITLTATVEDISHNPASDTATFRLASDAGNLPTISINEPIGGADNIVNDAEDNNLVISGTTTNVENGQVVTLTFTSTGGGAPVTATATVSNNTWTLPTTGALIGVDIQTLNDGTVTVLAEVKDAASNPASDTTSFLLDATPTNNLAIIAVHDDVGLTQGSVAQGAAIDDRRPTISGGGGEPGRPIRVYDGATLLGTTTADAKGNWVWKPTADLGDARTYAIHVVSVDTSGNETPPSNVRGFTIDTVKPVSTPTITSVSDDVAPIGNAGAPANVPSGGGTNDPTPTLTGAAAPNSVVQIFDDGVAIGTATAGSGGNWAFTADTLTDGSHSFTVATLSAAGVSGDPSAPYVVNVLTAIVTPTITSITPDNGPPNVVGSGSDLITNTAVPVINGTGVAGAIVSIYDGPTKIGEATVQSNGTWSFEVPPQFALTDGVHSLTATQLDTVGDLSLPSTVVSVTIDTVAPTANVSPEFIANPVTVGDQTYATLARVPGGGYVVSWHDSNLGSSFQRYDNAGNRIGDPVSYMRPMTWGGGTPMITVLSNGNIAQTYVADDANFSGVYLRIYSPTGALVRDDTLVSSVTSTYQAEPTVAALPNGNFVVSWGDGRGDSQYSTYIKIYSPTGNVVLNDTLLADSTTNNTHPGTIAVAANGNFLVPWMFESSSTGYNLLGQIYNSSGTPQTATFTINATVAGTQAVAQAVALPDGTYVIAWQGPDSDGTGLYFRRFSANGAALSGETAINMTTAGNQYFNLGVAAEWPSSGTKLTALANGGFAVVWTSEYQDGSGTGTFMRVFSATGVPTAQGEIPINTTIVGDQSVPAITTLSDGRLVVAWEDAGGDGSGQGIMQSIFNVAADGTVTPANPLSNMHLTSNQTIGQAELQFATGTTAAPEFRVGGNLVAYATIQDTYGIATTWDAANDKLILTGSANADVYDTVLHMLTLSATQTTVELRITDLAGNPAAAPVTGLEVTVPGAAIALVTPTQAVTITAATSHDGANPGTVGNGGTTDDLSLELSGTLSAPLSTGQAVYIYDTVGGVTSRIDTAMVTGASWISHYLSFAEGAHSYTARVVNLTGGQGTASAAYAVTIASDVPSIDLVTDHHAAVVSSIVDGGITNDARPVVSGRGAANTSVNVYDNGSLLGTARVDSAGDWSLLVPLRLIDGPHAFTAAYFFPASGNSGESTSPYTVTVDRTPPATPVISAISTASAPDAMGMTVPDATATLTGTAEPGTSIVIRDGATILNPTTNVIVNGTGQWSYTTPTLKDGEHHFTVTAVDATGNTSVPSFGVTLGVNSSPVAVPIIWSIVDNDGPVQGNLTNGSVTDDLTPTLHGTGAFPNGTVRIFNGATSLGTVTADVNGSWTYTPTLTNGQTVVFSAANVVSGVDGARSGAWTLTADRNAPAAPTITSLFDNEMGKFGDVANGGVTNDPRPVASGAGAPQNGLVNIHDTFGGITTLLGSTIADSTGNWAFNITGTLPDGQHSLSVTAVSVAGIESTAPSAPHNFLVDTAAPTVPVFTTAVDSGLSNSDGVTNDATQTLTGDPGSTEGNAVVTIHDGITVIGETTALGDGSWTFTTAAFAEGGPHNLNVTATDEAGNTSERSAVHAITVDTMAPGVSIENATVNTWLPSDQLLSHTAKLAGGGYVTIWISSFQDPGPNPGLGVYMQRFDALGNRLGVEQRVNTYTASDQSTAWVAGLADGSFVITWQSALQTSGTGPQDGAGLGVYMQRFAANGTPLGAETLVNTVTTTGDQSIPHVVALSNGNYAIAWNSSVSGSNATMLKVYAANGTLVLADTQVAAGAKFNSMVALTGGGFVVTERLDADPRSLRFTIHNNTGGIVTNVSTVGMYYTGYDLVALQNGGFGVISDHGLSSAAPYLQLYTAAGGVSGAPIALPAIPTSIIQLSNNNIAMAWSDSNVAYVQLAQANGALIGAPMALTQDPTHDNAAPVITALPNGRFMLSWQTNAGGEYDIVQHQFTNAGVSINQVAELRFADASDLVSVDVNFGAVLGSEPTLRDAATGTVYTIAEFNTAAASVNHGIQASWDGSILQLDGAVSPADYEAVVHMLIVGTASSVTVSITVTDLAGNQTVFNNLTVNPASITLSGTVGDDRFEISDTDTPVHGGEGFDTLALLGAGLTLDFTLLDQGAVTGIERIDLSGSGDNTLKLSLEDLLDITDFTTAEGYPQLNIEGDAGDVVQLVQADGFADSGADQTIGGVSFDVWNAGATPNLALLLIEQGLLVQQVA
ncbi:MAG: Ig-like domain-containing protein [Burkholderiaceae bacterium]|nr:Ig-like domain-containing protein [Burkholderiaceae bacterium]